MSRSLLVVLGVLLGVLGTLLILRILTVPPPAFTGASFANNAPWRVVKPGKVTVYYWTLKDRAKIPEEGDRTNPKAWAASGTKTLETSSNYYYHSLNLDAENVITLAMVVDAEATSGGAAEQYINFVPDAALGDKSAISSVVGSLENVAGYKTPQLQVRFFFGEGRSADKQDLDTTCYPPPVPR